MDPRAKRKALLAEARTLGLKAQTDGRDFTEEESARAVEIKSEVERLTGLIEKSDAAREALKALGANDPDTDEKEVRDAQVLDGKSDRIEVRDRPLAPLKSLGQAFVDSEAYHAFRKSFPSGAGSGSRIELPRTQLGGYKDIATGAKASLLTTDVARIQPVRYPTMDMIDRPRLTLLDIISHGSMAGSFEYVQITNVTRNAAIVAEATGAGAPEGADDPLKPISTFGTQLADAKPFTYADGFEVTNQLLSDAPAFATFMNAELAYSINTVIENYLLNGDGTNGTPKGILNTTGVQTQALDVDMVRTVRKAITKVTRVGGQVNGVLMSPEHDEAWDLLQDSNKRYYGQGPFGSGPGTAWGRPRIVSELLSGTDTMIAGDFSTMALLDREGLSIEAFNQHKDFAQRNKVYVRAELRAGQVIWRPNRLVVATAPA